MHTVPRLRLPVWPGTRNTSHAIGRTGLATLLACALSATALPGTAAGAPTDRPTATPEELGFDSARLAEVLAVMPEAFPGIHSLVAARGGAVFVEANFYPYDGIAPHGLESVAKAVTATLAGMAADAGLLSLDSPVLSFFPDREIANLDERKEALTVADLADMTTGYDCRPLDDMRASDDWVQFVLDMPMKAGPGTIYEYCNPASHLLSAVITAATGASASELATDGLFGPLGIGDVVWPADPQGVTHGWASLMLTPADAAAFGQLWLDGGQWDGQQILPSWLPGALTAPDATSPDGTGYALGWTVVQSDGVGPIVSARGGGGQYIVLIPALDVVVGTTGSGTYGPGDLIGALATALADPVAPLPPSPDGEAMLADTIEQLAAGPPPATDVASPATATAVSGVAYQLEPNPLGLEGLMLEFADGPEAQLTLLFADTPEPIVLPVGLDGRYRFVPGELGHPLGLRGTWQDERTFVLEYDTISNVTAVTLVLAPSTEGLRAEALDRTNGEVFEIAGRAT